MKLIPIENLSWDCLHIQALGKGQIQIKNANIIHIDTTISRAQWMSTFYERMTLYYEKAIQKIQQQQNIMQNRANEWDDLWKKEKVITCCRPCPGEFPQFLFT